MKRSMLVSLSAVLLAAGVAPAALAQVTDPITPSPSQSPYPTPTSPTLDPNPSQSPYTTPDATPVSPDTSPYSGAYSRTSSFEPSAFQLVDLARNGYLEEQGIPSFVVLTRNYRTGNITAEDVIQAAIQDGRISSEQADSTRYEQAVEVEMESLFRPGRNR